MRVDGLYRYPVKGLTPEALEGAVLSPGACLPHDRRFALAQGDAPFDPAAPAWLRKTHFGCLMANAGLARVASRFDPDTGRLSLAAPDAAPLEADTGTPEGREAIGAWLAARLGDAARGTPRFLEAPGHNFTDQARKAVSIVSLASIRALEAATGAVLDARRFRANLVLADVPAWAEFDWIGREVRVGGAVLRPFVRTVRCPAVEVNPDTGERDADPVRGLRRHFGHADLGVHAEVVAGGRVAPGDAVAPA